MYKTTIYGYAPSDRNIVIITDGNKLVGINYWQGLNEMSICESFMTPDLMLTGYVASEVEDNAKEHGLSFDNPNNEMLEFIDDAIWKYFERGNKERTITLPKSQTELIKEALKFYRQALNDMPLSEDRIDVSHYREFDLITLSALLSYDVSITLTESQVDRFCARHGVDFPEYI